MAVTQPPNIDAPPVAPQRKDRNTFAGRVDAFLTWLITAVAQFLALAANVFNNAQEAYNSAAQALASADAAAAAAKTATLTANAAMFDPAFAYGQGQAAIAPANLQVYRRKSAGVSVADPSTDPNNWQRAINDPFGAVDALNITGDTALTLNSRNVLRVAATIKNTSLRLPVATSINNANGTYLIKNIGAYPLALRDSAGTLLAVLPGGGASGIFACEDFSTVAGTWLVMVPENIGAIATGAATFWATAVCNWISVSAIPGVADKALIAWCAGGNMYAAIASRSGATMVSVGAPVTLGAGNASTNNGSMCVAMSATAAFVASPNPATAAYGLYALSLNVVTNTVTVGYSLANAYGAVPTAFIDPQPQVLDATRAAWLVAFSNTVYLMLAQHNGSAVPAFSVQALNELNGAASAAIAHVGNGNLMLVGAAGGSLNSTAGTAITSLGVRSWGSQNVIDLSSGASNLMFSQGNNRAAVISGISGTSAGSRDKTFTVVSSGGAPNMPSGHRHFPSGSVSGSNSYLASAVVGTTYCLFGSTYSARGHGMRLMRYANDALFEFAYSWPDDMPHVASNFMSWRVAGVGGQFAIAASLDASGYPQVVLLEVCKV
ncbi:hypothetical protein GJ698_22145 [Pseudoduganella sp. FT26W]|uniref:Uncharacterized protein n=1 Tax=Duganella aquatilis TaxID=2666082 RepID=A0A844DDR0_9BURK|nr:hypothetical protein [Duganella aquatilis]MRW86776.1 hypothetical protein [Duganella aquatilis]